MVSSLLRSQTVQLSFTASLTDSYLYPSFFRRLIGFITRSQIIVLLKRQQFLRNYTFDDHSFADSYVSGLRRRTAAPPGSFGSVGSHHGSFGQLGFSSGLTQQQQFSSQNQHLSSSQIQSLSPCQQQSQNQHPSSNEETPEVPLLTTADFRDAYPRYPDINTLEIPESDMNSLIDFRPYMNDSPYHMNYSEYNT